jgi:diamine N-acetyltransferase
MPSKSARKPVPEPGNRVADASEAEALAQFSIKQFCDNFAHLYTPQDLQTFLASAYDAKAIEQSMRDGSCTYLVTEDERGYTGYLKYGLCKLPVENPPARHAEIHQLYIDKDAQSSGLGQLLMDAALERLEPLSDAIYLGVWSQNLRAQRFYQHYGFKPVGQYHFMVGEQADLEFILLRHTN